LIAKLISELEIKVVINISYHDFNYL